jgi:uncharacterized repeat protein (TIGR01451 family)
MKTPARRRLVSPFNFLPFFGLCVIAVVGMALPVVHSSSLKSTPSASVVKLENPLVTSAEIRNWKWLSSFVALPVAGESVTLYAADCATPKTQFIGAELVCAKTDGVDLTVPGNHYMNWIDSQLNSTNGGTITQNPQYFLFSAPAADTYKATIGSLAPADSSIVGNPPIFTVSVGAGLGTLAADCVTPKTSYVLGETVCVRTSGGTGQSRVQLINPAGYAFAREDINTDPDTMSFTLPTGTTFDSDLATYDNRGPWRVTLVDNPSAGVRFTTPITVHDPQQTVANLQVVKTLSGSSTPTAGSNIQALVRVFNGGPDAASAVEFTDVLPANTTFVSLTQNSGPTFGCTTPSVGGIGTSVCTLAVLAPNTSADFVVIYQVSGSIGNLASLTTSASATSTTAETSAVDNSSSDSTTASNPAPPPCTLTCPSNITTGSNMVNSSGQAGAIVTFANATTSGTCGTITSTPASGSFFAVGSSVVTQEASTGQECSFIVTVVDDDAPTISCPANITVNETSAGAGAAVNYTGLSASDNGGTPTITCQEGTDNRPSGSTFAVGTHTITCTATDEDNNTSPACSFDITVNAAPACALTPPANVSVNSPANACGTNVTYDSPTADSNCASGTTISCDHASGSFFAVGETVVTCTSSPDGATTSFTVTVNDVTGPVPDVATLPTVTGECTATAGIPTTVIIRDQFGNPIGTKIVSELPRATDSCDGSTTGATNDQRTYDEPGTYTVNWTYTDASGNTSTQEQTVIVTSPSGGLNITGAPLVTVHNPVGSTSCSMVIDDLTSLLNTTVSGTCNAVDISRTISPPAPDNVFSVGTTYTVVSTVVDGSSTASVTQTFKLIDDTPPVITSIPPNATYQCLSEVPAGNPSQATATDNCGTPTITVTDTNNGGAGSTSNPLVITRTFTATDESGRTDSEAQTITVIDNTLPTISCPANITVYLPLNSTATSTVVNYTAPVGSDNCGTATTTQTAGLAGGASFPVGTTTNTFRVTDGVGQTAECSFTVTVLYNFTGFFSPVSNPPVVNNVTAGRAIPLKFSLSGDKGLNIFAAGYPASQQITCDSSAPIADLEGTETSGGSTLTYSPDTYHYSWKTESSWVGTCRTLVVRLNDGTDHIALFKFK